MKPPKRISLVLATGFCLLMIISCTKDDLDVLKPEDVEKWTYFDIGNGLPSNQINCLAEDAYHNLWIGTNRGLVKYDGTRFSIYTRKEGLQSDTVYSLVSSFTNGVIVGTHNGLGRFLSGKYYRDISSKNLHCRNMCASTDGNYIYCGTDWGYYVYDFNTGYIRRKMVDSTLYNGTYFPDAVFDIAYQDKNNLWVSGEKGLYIVTPTKTILHTNEELGLFLFTQLFKDKAGNIWITSPENEKVIYYNGSKFVDNPIFLDQNNYKAFTQDKYSNYWISIEGYGVLNYGGGMSKVYNASNSKIKSNDINDILYDSKGNIWLGSNDRGLMYYQNIKPLQFRFDSGKNSETNPNPIN